MKNTQSRIRRACPPAMAALLSCTVAGTAAAQDTPAQAPTMDQLRQMLIEQTRRLDDLRSQMEQEQSRLDDLRREVGLERLRTLRAAGPGEPAAANPPQPVGQRPPEKTPADSPPVAQIFDQPGILTQPGTLILEPSLQYSYASTNRVALVGYTVIPALTIGLIDVREVKRNTWTAALTARTGLTNRLEVEAKIPWVYRSDDSISRPIATPSSNDQVFNTTGSDIGDVEFTARYQLNPTVANEPIYVASLRFKTRTGSDQFDTTTLIVPGFQGLGLLRDLPTGSGFYSIQPGLTFLFPSDPVVFFGGLNYQYSFERSNLKLRQDDGQGNITVTNLDKVQPGGVFGFNFGMGLALNDRSSFSVGYDHASVGVTRINGRDDPLGVRVQLGTLMFGYAYRLAPDRAVNVSLGVGVTRDTPDLTLTLRMPFTL
ncbi:acetate kinase [Denitromonas iodatirespirans]|uniref:Acetate kinase n=1 Tax=Denitromonas iodatirespirans TaxID=2795389 RepID=A0A944H9Q6_DENI1|nr:acetate kinase [Denitromonas iodatirespirans]MBT0963489.1 acetate kinase [Denitromonas iodatirespirans]